jgi:tripartite-type tricarboxylate transporter receptor subunit TctC
MDRRSFVIGSTAATAATLLPGRAFAQDAANYPSRAITFINPFPPGGAADVVGRPFAAVLEPIIKQAAVIDTKAGAAGAVGAQVAANAGRLYAAVAHRFNLGVFRGRQAVRPAAEIYPGGFHSDRAVHR